MYYMYAPPAPAAAENKGFTARVALKYCKKVVIGKALQVKELAGPMEWAADSIP
jgi:hypothetical protein